MCLSNPAPFRLSSLLTFTLTLTTIILIPALNLNPLQSSHSTVLSSLLFICCSHHIPSPSLSRLQRSLAPSASHRIASHRILHTSSARLSISALLRRDSKSSFFAVLLFLSSLSLCFLSLPLLPALFPLYALCSPSYPLCPCCHLF